MSIDVTIFLVIFFWIFRFLSENDPTHDCLILFTDGEATEGELNPENLINKYKFKMQYLKQTRRKNNVQLAAVTFDYYTPILINEVACSVVELNGRSNHSAKSGFIICNRFSHFFLDKKKLERRCFLRVELSTRLRARHAHSFVSQVVLGKKWRLGERWVIFPGAKV